VTMGPDVKPKGRDELVFRPLDEEWVVYDPRTRELHVLNRAAAIVWICCDGRTSVRDIVQAVTESFNGQVDEQQAETDVQKALGDFVERGMLA